MIRSSVIVAIACSTFAISALGADSADKPVRPVFDEQGVVARRTTFVIDRQGVVQKVFMAQESLDPNSALEVCALLKEVN